MLETWDELHDLLQTKTYVAIIVTYSLKYPLGKYKFVYIFFLFYFLFYVNIVELPI